jgi:hypothetical protein
MQNNFKTSMIKSKNYPFKSYILDFHNLDKKFTL